MVRVQMLWYRKRLRVCEELWLATAGFRRFLSLLFAMIFGSQIAPCCCSVDLQFIYVCNVLYTFCSLLHYFSMCVTLCQFLKLTSILLKTLCSPFFYTMCQIPPCFFHLIILIVVPNFHLMENGLLLNLYLVYWLVVHKM
jgi:hypothetical protein